VIDVIVDEELSVLTTLGERLRRHGQARSRVGKGDLGAMYAIGSRVDPSLEAIVPYSATKVAGCLLRRQLPLSASWVNLHSHRSCDMLVTLNEALGYRHCLGWSHQFLGPAVVLSMETKGYLRP
jgi:hypothetical protein